MCVPKGPVLGREPIHHPHLALSRCRAAHDPWLVRGSLQAEERAPEPPASRVWAPAEATSSCPPGGVGLAEGRRLWAGLFG